SENALFRSFTRSSTSVSTIFLPNVPMVSPSFLVFETFEYRQLSFLCVSVVTWLPEQDKNQNAGLRTEMDFLVLINSL
ncbi:MAG: hypothetical protein MIO88_01340, partial [Methanoregulaceae archaeon]|nr:hypothetical protein [Methanoregulaceae archaeon]